MTDTPSSSAAMTEADWQALYDEMCKRSNEAARGQSWRRPLFEDFVTTVHLLRERGLLDV